VLVQLSELPSWQHWQCMLRLAHFMLTNHLNMPATGKTLIPSLLLPLLDWLVCKGHQPVFSARALPPATWYCLHLLDMKSKPRAELN
jgi:hypothetical protein